MASFLLLCLFSWAVFSKAASRQISLEVSNNKCCFLESKVQRLNHSALTRSIGIQFRHTSFGSNTHCAFWSCLRTTGARVFMMKPLSEWELGNKDSDNRTGYSTHEAIWCISYTAGLATSSNLNTAIILLQPAQFPSSSMPNALFCKQVLVIIAV